MHFYEMALYDLAKRFCLDAFANVLLKKTGLSNGRQTHFASDKDPKTNRRVLSQILLVSSRRVVVVLVEDGFLSSECVACMNDDPLLFPPAY